MRKLKIDNCQLDVIMPLVILMITSDGRISRKEVSVFRDFLTNTLAISDDLLKYAEKLWKERDKILERDVDQIISEAASHIDKKNINTIYRFLIYLSFADGVFHPNEYDLLIKVRDAFGISKETADELLEELKIGNKVKIKKRNQTEKIPMKTKYAEVILPLVIHMMSADGEATDLEIRWFEGFLSTLVDDKEVRNELRRKVVDKIDDILAVEPSEYIKKGLEILDKKELEDVYNILLECMSCDLRDDDGKVEFFMKVGEGFGFPKDKIMESIEVPIQESKPSSVIQFLKDIFL
jgi:uncharacterized tellurite resistance protein B-like protein